MLLVAALNFASALRGPGAPQARFVPSLGAQTAPGLCPPGQVDQGFGCVDVNECATANGGCFPNPTGQPSCFNTIGSRICADCPSGYTGDGITCLDVNECAAGNGGCSPFGLCTNTAGSRTCGACSPGYTGDGMTCSDVNECATGNGGCSPFAVCTNTSG